MMQPFNFKKWIDEHRHLLKPPVGNAQVYKEADNLIVMVVGGPNARKDYHYNETEELFYQLEGDITVGIIDDHQNPKEITIREGEMFLLPGKIPHSPRRPANTVGLVIETVRQPDAIDGFLWFCENCGNKLYEEYFHMEDIVKQLPPVMNRFFDNKEIRTCDQCGHVTEKPEQKTTAPAE